MIEPTDEQIEAARQACDMPVRDIEAMLIAALNVEPAEPNAAGQGKLTHNAETVGNVADQPAPAAPDLAALIRRLNGYVLELKENAGITDEEGDVTNDIADASAALEQMARELFDASAEIEAHRRSDELQARELQRVKNIGCDLQIALGTAERDRDAAIASMHQGIEADRALTRGLALSDSAIVSDAYQRGRDDGLREAAKVCEELHVQFKVESPSPRIQGAAAIRALIGQPVSGKPR